MLSALNVVEPRHGGGTYVTSLDPRQLAQPINFLLQVDRMAFRHLLEVRQVAAAARLQPAGEVAADHGELGRDGQPEAGVIGCVRQPTQRLV